MFRNPKYVGFVRIIVQSIADTILLRQTSSDHDELAHQPLGEPYVRVLEDIRFLKRLEAEFKSAERKAIRQVI